MRFGGCDFDCSWCDTRHAVDKEYRANWHPTEPKEIIARLLDLTIPFKQRSWPLITLSGGNPAIYDLNDLVIGLVDLGFDVSCETQGSIYRHWLDLIDPLVLSPKPPSSGMANKQLERLDILKRCYSGSKNPHLKIVVSDETDFQWAMDLFQTLDAPIMWLQPCSLLTPTAKRLAMKYRWLCERVIDERNYALRVLPQLHVLIWGNDKVR